jgi:hypothetical protein
VLDVDDVVYVDDVADEGGRSTGSGGRDELLAVWITAHTRMANSSTPAAPAATITGCWSCQLPSSSGLTPECYAQRASISLACAERANWKNGPKLMRPTPSGPNDAGSS